MASDSPDSSWEESVSTSDDSKKEDSPADTPSEQVKSKAGKRKRSLEEVITEKFDALSEVLQQNTTKRKTHDFKYVSNREQFHFNAEVMDDLERTAQKADSKMSRKLKSTITKLKTRNKLIKMADRSKAGWRIVEEYLTDDIASDPKDDRKIKKAEKAALKKMKEEKEKKQDVTRNPRRTKAMMDEKFRNAPGSSRNKAADTCFRCGKKGHWGSECRKYRNEEIYDREERYRRY
jgi:hypothetical protein